MVSVNCCGLRPFTKFIDCVRQKETKGEGLASASTDGGSSYWSISRRPELTSTNLVGFNGHFQTAVNALQFHSGHQQTLRADRRSNLGCLPVTSGGRTSPKTLRKTQIRTRYTDARLASSDALAAAKYATQSAAPAAAARQPASHQASATHQNCLHHKHRFGAVKATKGSWKNDKYLR